MIDRHLQGHRDSLFIHGIASFLILSYAKFLLVSFDILRPVDASGFGGERVATLVFLDGSSTHFSNKHYPYAILALLALCIFVIPVPLILILCTGYNVSSVRLVFGDIYQLRNLNNFLMSFMDHMSKITVSMQEYCFCTVSYYS